MPKTKRHTQKSSPSTKKPTKRRLWLAVPMAVVLLVAVGFGLIYTSIFVKTQADKTTLTIKKGDTYQSVLLDGQWEQNPLFVAPIAKAYLKFTAKKPLQAGTYQIPAKASLADTLKVLEKGAEVAMVKIQIIEGKTIKDLYHTIKTTDGVTLKLLTPAKDTYTWADVATDNAQVGKALGLSSANGNLEGQFAPDTYYFAMGVSDEAILKQLHTRQQSLLDKAWQARQANLPYKSPAEMLIMASIIEKETGVASEREKVSAVFVNRLRLGMRLQTDPTIIYGLFDRYDGKIYKSNISEKNAYNTYQIDGLPPTPIALPSEKAILASANPADTDVLFFVATGTGGHTFSRTLDEHNKAVAEYRKVMADKE